MTRDQPYQFVSDGETGALIVPDQGVWLMEHTFMTGFDVTIDQDEIEITCAGNDWRQFVPVRRPVAHFDLHLRADQVTVGESLKAALLESSLFDKLTVREVIGLVHRKLDGRNEKGEASG